MNSTFKALRSIGSEFARRLYAPIAIIFSITTSLLLVGGVLLTTLSAWWWILVILLMILALIFSTILIITGIIIRGLRPPQSKQQAIRVKSFVDKIQGLADVVSTPKVVILFRVVRDMTTQNKSGYLQTISSETLSMRNDFRDIIGGFATPGGS